MFDIVGYFGSSFLSAEISLHALQIVFKQLVGILIDIIECAIEIDLDILFHCLVLILI